MIEIFNSAGVLQCSFPCVLSASLCDKLSGERTLSFSVLASRSQPLRVGMTAKLDGQFYNIVRVSKKITGGFPVTTAQCEHITYLLNEEQYNLVTFVFEGTPADGISSVMQGMTADMQTAIPSHINMDTTLSGLSDVGRTFSGQAFNVTIPLTIDGTTLARILAEIQWTQNAAYVRNLGMA